MAAPTSGYHDAGQGETLPLLNVRATQEQVTAALAFDGVLASIKPPSDCQAAIVSLTLDEEVQNGFNKSMHEELAKKRVFKGLLNKFQYTRNAFA